MALRRDAPWQSYRESLLTTLLRTGLLALIFGAVMTRWMGGPARWPLAILVALWPTFGGHWVELWFLNYLRPRLPFARTVQIVVRLVVWFMGGTLLALGMKLTAITLAGITSSHLPAFWLGGLAFIAIELSAHLVLQLRGRPAFYNGRG